MDGNMVSDGCVSFEYDSANRLIKADGHTYTYNAEDVRIRNLCSDSDTTYTYNTNCKLSQLLQKTTNGITTKYVYGHGLIGEEKCGEFKTYHFDFRGSTVAITDINGNVTDTFKYDTYGNVTQHIGDSFVIFGYNGRDGVVTDKNGLIYMRARYYSPEMRRFINADILHGEISDSTSLNRYSYVNGNPVSFVDPFGLSKDADRNAIDTESLFNIMKKIKNKKDKKAASSLLASTIDQLLNFKNIFTIMGEGTISFFSGSNTYGEISVSASTGNGNIEISSVVSEQFELLGSISFDISNLNVSTNSKGKISISYSSDIDEYNTIAASISGTLGVSISAGYTITTTDKYDNSVSTSLRMTHYDENNSKPNKAPQLETVPSTATDSDWGLRLAGLGLLIWGVANNVTGVGFGDDLVTIPTAIAMLF